MRESSKVAGIFASCILGMMPVMASAQIHSHPNRQVLAEKARVARDQANAAFEANYNQSRPVQPLASSCGSNCAPLQMYGIGY